MTVSYAALKARVSPEYTGAWSRLRAQASLAAWIAKPDTDSSVPDRFMKSGQTESGTLVANHCMDACH